MANMLPPRPRGMGGSDFSMTQSASQAAGLNNRNLRIMQALGREGGDSGSDKSASVLLPFSQHTLY